MSKAKHIIYLILFFLLLVNRLPAQNDSVKCKNNLILIRLGFPLLYSIDYDRVFWQKRKLKTTASIGFSFSPLAIGVPLNINFLAGKRVCWESGVGFSYYAPLNDNQTYKKYIFFTINPVGLRYTGKKGFTAFCKFGYFYGDLRWIGGDMFYDKNCNKKGEHGFFPFANINVGIGSAF